MWWEYDYTPHIHGMAWEVITLCWLFKRVKVFFLLLFCLSLFFAYLTTYLLAFTDSSKLMKVFHHENDFFVPDVSLTRCKRLPQCCCKLFSKGLSRKFHLRLFSSLKRSQTINYFIINSSAIFCYKWKSLFFSIIVEFYLH